jgi:hypothetical protein
MAIQKKFLKMTVKECSPEEDYVDFFDEMAISIRITLKRYLTSEKIRA